MKTFFSWDSYHLIGIGGSGLSGLARLLKQMGKNVSGSDEKFSPTIAALQEEKFSVEISHQSQNIPEKTQVIIYSPAIPTDNPERIEAKKRGLPQYSYPEAVGFLTQEKDTIAVCGTHGKTTTTAMIAATLISAGKDPTVIVGAPTPELKQKNERFGQSRYFVLEACEYRRAFLNYRPKIIVLTNIEADHLDYFRDLEDYKNAFQEFIQKIPADGFVVANYDDENVRAICGKLNVRKIWFGRAIKEKSANTADVHYQLKNNQIWKNNLKIAELNLSVPGDHNLMNAIAAFAMCHELQADLTRSLEALNNYKGAARRFELKGQIKNTLIYDDYAHHPTEIKATLQAARQKFGPQAKILCIFQPHQYSRTYKLLDEFAAAFTDATEVIIPNILQVRDSASDLEHINPKTLVDKINQQGMKTTYGESLEKTVEIVANRITEFDVIFTMGAGDVWKIAESLTKKI